MNPRLWCVPWLLALLPAACTPVGHATPGPTPETAPGDARITPSLAAPTPTQDATVPPGTPRSTSGSATPIKPVLMLSDRMSLTGWSPDGKWIGYRDGDEVDVLNAATGESCSLGTIPQVGAPNADQLWDWLADGRVLIVDPDKREASAATPCLDQRDVSVMQSLQGTIRQIAAVSPDHHLFVMDTSQGYRFYDARTGKVWEIEPAVTGPDIWGFAWSPRLTRLAISAHLPTRDPDTKTWTVDVATGNVIGEIEWANWIADPPQGPDWMDESRFVIVITRAKRGPLLVTPGEGAMGIPAALFGLDCDATACPNTTVRSAIVQSGGSYHLLLADLRQRDAPSLLYHSETGMIEPLDGAELSPDGRWLLRYVTPSAESGGHTSGLRAVDPPGASWKWLDIPAGMWLPNSRAIIAGAGSTVSLYGIPDGLLHGQWQAEGYSMEYLDRRLLSPDRKRLLVVGQDSQGASGLFVLDLP